MMRTAIRGLLIAASLLLLIGAIDAQPSLPVPDSKVLATLRGYVECTVSEKVVKYELADTYTEEPKQVGAFLYPTYSRDCYYYVEDAYGRVTRFTVAISFINLKADIWDFDEARYEMGSRKVVKAATNPPAPPAKPTVQQLFAIVDDAMRLAVSSAPSAKYDFALREQNLAEPQFAWVDDDFTKGQYTYEGTLIFRLTPRQGPSGKAPKDVKEKNSTAKGSLQLFYDAKAAAWSANVNMNWVD
jgi:hypothetical protein